MLVWRGRSCPRLSISPTAARFRHPSGSVSRPLTLFPQRRRNDVLRHELRLPRKELVPLRVIPSCDYHHHIEVRKNQHILPAVSRSIVITKLASARFENPRVPGVGISMVCIRRNDRRKPRVPRHRILYPSLAQDALPVPRSARKIKLPQLQLIASSQVKP